MALSQQQQQDLTDHLKQSGLFGGKIDVAAIARILQLIATALASLGGGSSGQTGGGQVSGGP
jgi:hypothetical protein